MRVGEVVVTGTEIGGVGPPHQDAGILLSFFIINGKLPKMIFCGFPFLAFELKLIFFFEKKIIAYFWLVKKFRTTSQN